MTHSLRLLLLNIILNCISKLNYFRLPQQCGFRPQARWTVSSRVQCSAYIPTHPIPAPTQSLLWCPLRFGSSVQLCIGMFHLVSPIFHISPAFENDCSYSPDLMPVSSSQRHFQCLLSFSGLPLFISPPTSPAPPRSFFLLSQQPFNTFKVIFNAMFIILIVLQWINQGLIKAPSVSYCKKWISSGHFLFSCGFSSLSPHSVTFQLILLQPCPHAVNYPQHSDEEQSSIDLTDFICWNIFKDYLGNSAFHEVD